MALTTFVLRSSALARIRIKALHQTALWPSVPLRATIGQVLAGERHNVKHPIYVSNNRITKLVSISV